MSRTATALVAVITCAVGVLIAAPVSAGTADRPAKDLPSAYEAELRDAKAVPMGRAVNFGYCVKYSATGCAKLVPLRVTVRSIAYRSADGWPPVSALFTITVKIENFTKISAGVLPKLRCANMTDEGSYYVGSADVQSLPPKSQLTGDVVSAFPHKDSDTPTVLPSNCQEPVIWLKPNGAINGRQGALRLYDSAYVRIPVATIASLDAAAVAGVAARPAS